jgi:cyclase
VKGVRFRDHRVVGEIIELADRYVCEGADELVFYDITASPEGRTVDRSWVNNVAAVLDIPFCVAGGIRTVADAEVILNNGADKVSINSPALEKPTLISELARRFGSQCVVLGVDSRKVSGAWKVYKYTGDASRSSVTTLETAQWIRQAQDLGAGEVVLNCINHDGACSGYDLDQLGSIGESCNVPLVASGGAGSMQDFADVFRKTNVSAALAASVFHDNTFTVSALKNYLHDANVEVRI